MDKGVDIPISVAQALGLTAAKEGIRGKIRIRIAKNPNDFLNNVLPDAIRVFVGGLVRSLTPSVGIENQDKLDEIQDEIELNLKDEFAKFVRRRLPDWVEDEDPDFEGGESKKLKNTREIIQKDNEEFEGEEENDFM